MQRSFTRPELEVEGVSLVGVFLVFRLRFIEIRIR